MDQEKFQRILNYANYLLQARSYSEANLIKKLKFKYKNEDKIILQICKDLKRIGLIDDKKYASNFIEYRLNSSPRGVKLLKNELIKKGIKQEIIDEIFEELEIDEREFIKMAMEKKLKTYPEDLNPDKKKEKLIRFLLSRGFEASKVFEMTKTQ